MNALAAADFLTRMAGGLAIALLGVGGREVPARFFRTVWLVVLGLSTLGLIMMPRDAVTSAVPIGLIVWCAAAMALSILWGAGLVGPARVLGALGLAAIVSVWWALPDLPETGGWETLTVRLISAWLLGSITAAMMLGHHYLTAPTMSLEPLKRLVLGAGIALSARVGLSILMLALDFQSGAGARTWGSDPSPLFLFMRWGMGVLAPGLGLGLTWLTVRIRSTQSATGILYIAVALTIVGELTALFLAGGASGQAS